MVYANINSSEEDFSFLLTALYHWETQYPTLITLEQPKDPQDIVIKSTVKEEKKPASEEEKKALEGLDASELDAHA